MIGALIFSVVAALCGQVQDLNPGGAMLDAIEWTVPSKDFRATQHMEGSDGNYMSTYVTTDKIWNLKTPGGDVWDVSYYDADGIWSWTTEYKWGDPTTYTRFLTLHQVLHAPRQIRAGYPGMRWISCDSRYTPITDCGAVVRVNGLKNIINESWGPYRVDTWGNIGTVDVLKLVYFYDCTGYMADTCTAAEVNWYAPPYGWIRWSLWQADGKGGPFTMLKAAESFNAMPGTAKPVFPCDTP